MHNGPCSILYINAKGVGWFWILIKCGIYVEVAYLGGLGHAPLINNFLAIYRAK